MNHHNKQEEQISRLTITQINTCKLDTSMHNYLPCDKGRSHIIAFQKPSIDFQGMTRALSHYTTIYPTNHFKDSKENRTRSVIMISAKIPSGSWTQIPINSPNVTAVELKGDIGTIRLFNIYNDGNHDKAINSIKAWAHTPEARHIPKQPLHTIWMGDFNRHHPMWDEPQNHHLFTPQNLNTVQRLLNAIADQGLFMVLLEHIPTLKSFAIGNYTRIDNVFCTKQILKHVVKCDTIPQRQPTNTDHFPIETVIDIGVEVTDQREQRNWKKVDWETFNEKLETQLKLLTEPKEIERVKEFWERLKEVDETVKVVIKEEVPLAKPSPMQQCWWTNELTNMRKLRNNLAGKSYRKRAQPNHPVHEQYRRARQSLSAEIKRAKSEKWVEFLTNADGNAIWDISRMVEAGPKDGGRTRIPELLVKKGDIE